MEFSILDIIGAVIGMVYIVSEYRANRLFWPASLLMSAFYMVIYFQARCYANTSICLYNLLMSVYGLLVWRGIVGAKKREGEPENKEKPIGSCPLRYAPWLILATVGLTLLLHWLLGLLGESQLPWLDGLSSALNIVGMWMLTRKYWQQWFTWLIVEPLMIVICLKSGLYASAAMYVVYEVFCVLGLIRWRKQSIR